MYEYDQGSNLHRLQQHLVIVASVCVASYNAGQTFEAKELFQTFSILFEDIRFVLRFGVILE